MAKEAKNRKYLVLDDVRVSYRSKDDSIHLLSTDADFPSGFHLPLQKGTHVEDVLRNLLLEKGHIAKEENRDQALPKKAVWAKSYIHGDHVSSSFFPLGVGVSGGVPTVNPYTGETFSMLGLNFDGRSVEAVKSYGLLAGSTVAHTPHVLIAGVPGAGKSILLQNVIRGAVLRPNHWRVMAIDLSQKSSKGLYVNPSTQASTATTLESALSSLEAALATMKSAYKAMSTAGVNKYLDLLDAPKGLIVAIDEASLLTANVNHQSAKAGIIRAKIRSILDEIASSGRAAGVHLVLTTQHPASLGMSGSFKANLDTRILCGKAHEELQLATLATTSVAGASHGSFVMRTHATSQIGQGFIASGE